MPNLSDIHLSALPGDNADQKLDSLVRQLNDWARLISLENHSADVGEGSLTLTDNQLLLTRPSGTTVIIAGQQDLASAIDEEGNFLAIQGSSIEADTITGTNILTLDITGKNAVFDTGTIGGWTMADDNLSSNGANVAIRANQTAYDTGTGFWLGEDSGTPKFSIGNSAGNKLTWDGTTLSITGTLTATTGTIGGFSIGTDYIRDAANSFGLASTVSGSDDVRFWAGASFANRATAPFRVTESGLVTASDGTNTFTVTPGSLTIQVVDDSNAQVLFDVFQRRTSIIANGADAGEIQDALDYLAAGEGGVVFLRNGTYIFDADISVPSNCTLQGETGDGVVLDADGAAVQLKVIGTDVYSTGTITVSNGDTTVTGSGTTWDVSMVGQSIHLRGIYYVITAVNSTTELEIEAPYESFDLSGSIYSIATPANGVTIDSLTIIDSTDANGAVQIQYGQDISCLDVTVLDSTLGAKITNCWTVNFADGFFAGCTKGLEFSDSSTWTLYNFEVYGSTGNNVELTRIYNVSYSNFSNSTAGDGAIVLDSCSNMGLYDFSLAAPTGIGIELTGCTDIEIFGANIANSGSDGVKLTSGNERISINNLSLLENGGWGINIAGATDTTITGSYFDGNTSGTITNSGTDTTLIGNRPDGTTLNSPKINENVALTATSTELNYVDGVTSAVQTQLDAKLAKASNLSDVASASTSFTNIKQAASETTTGVVELATTGEAVIGTDTTRAITPATLTARLGSPGTIGNTIAGAITGTTITANTGFMPDANDGAYLGQSGTAFSDLFLASGAVVDFAAGNAVLTHSSGILTVSTGELRITSVGTNAASVPTLSSTSSFSNKSFTGPTTMDDVEITGTLEAEETIVGTSLDMDGNELILDADADTSITADTDDQIDFKIAAADDFRMTANTFTALSGSTIATNTIAETTAASGVTVDGLLIKDSKLATNDSVVTANITADSVTATKLDWASTGADAGIWWEELQRTTLGSDGDTITVSSIPVRKYLHVRIVILTTGVTNLKVQFNSDTGSNYSYRVSTDFNTGGTATSNSNLGLVSTAAAQTKNAYIDIVNVATLEKYPIATTVESGGGGAANAPSTRELFGKWSNNTDAITSITIFNDGAGSFVTGSQAVVLGHD